MCGLIIARLINYFARCMHVLSASSLGRRSCKLPRWRPARLAMAGAAHIQGTFVLGTGDVPGTQSVHLLEWQRARRRTGAGGVFGWAKCLGSHPASESLPADNFRIHVCSQLPCIAMYGESRHGTLPGPLAHGQVLAEGVELSSLATFLKLPAIPPPLPPPPDPASESAAAATSPSSSAVAAAVGSPAVAVAALESAAAATSPSSSTVAAAVGSPAVAVAAAASSSSSSSSDSDSDSDSDSVRSSPAAILPPLPPPPDPASESAAAATSPSSSAVAAAVGSPAVAVAALESAAAATSPSSSAAATSPSSPAAPAAASPSPASAVVAEQPVPFGAAPAGAAAMLRRADASGRMATNIGLLEFVAFCYSHRRRLKLLLPEGEVDVVTAFAAALLDETWALVPFARLVVPVAKRGAHWCMASYSAAIHFMAAVPAARRFVEGQSASAEGARRGYHILATVADGNCGPDALLAVAGGPRDIAHQHGMRLRIRGVLLENAVSPVWHEIAATCQETAAPIAAPVATPAAARPSDAKPPPPRPPAAGPAVAQSSVAEPVVAAELAVAKPLVEPAVAGPSAAQLAVAKPLAAEPWVPGPSATESAAASLSSAGPLSCSALDVVPAGLLADLDRALRWSTGLPNPTPATVRRLAAMLTDEQATGLVKAHRDSIVAVLPTSQNKRTGIGTNKRAHVSRLVHVRLADAKAFADWAADNGMDHRTKDCSHKMRQYMRESSAVPNVSDSQLRRGRQYLVRCLQLYMDSTFVRPSKVAARSTKTRGGGVAFRGRRRKLGTQGRPEKALMVKEYLFKWFSAVRRSIRGRIPPSLMIAKAKVLMEGYVEEHAMRGERADAAAVNYNWLSRWKFQYRVSLRQPNRKWSVPRHIMKERLEIVWCNIFKIRRLMARCFGYDPIIENFDQSPFHMNEVGSKAAGSLTICGGGSVALVEGHAATRERWSANTMVASRPAVAGRLPPLQLMFKAATGARILPKLKEAVPAWASWLSVEVSPSGSYNEGDILNYLDLVLDEMTPDRDWRILLVDAYAAQTTEAVRRACWHRGYVLISHGGGTTGVAQVNDTDLHQTLKRLYIELESAEMLDQQRLRPGGVPVPKKEDCISWMAHVWHSSAMHSAVAEGFWKTGQANALDGSQDNRIVRESRPFWDELQMWRRRADVIHDVDVEFDRGRLAWSYDDVARMVVAFPKHGPRYDADHSDDGSEAPNDEGDSDGDDGGLGDDDDDLSGGESDIGGVPAVAGGEPAVAGCKPAVADHAGAAAEARPLPLVSMNAAEADIVHEHRHSLDILRAVLDEVVSVGHDALAATVSHAIVVQERKCRGTNRSSDAVARAMEENCTSAVAGVAAARTTAAKADFEAKRARWTVKQLQGMHHLSRNAWGSEFRNEMLELLKRLKDGKSDALQHWMAKQSRLYLAMPALCVQAGG